MCLGLWLGVGLCPLGRLLRLGRGRAAGEMVRDCGVTEMRTSLCGMGSKQNKKI